MTDRESNYTYDPKSRRFRGPDGRYIAASEIIGIRDEIIVAKKQRTATLVNSLYAGTLTPAAFVLAMRTEIQRTVLMEYMLGRGGANALTQDDYGRIGGILKPQYQYLNTFTTQIMNGDVTKDQATRRAGMYIDASRNAHSRGVSGAWDIDLPAYPGIHPYCACVLDFHDRGDRVHVYWTTQSANACHECEGYESEWNPLVIERPEP